MGLRNMFDAMATEGTLRELVRTFQEGRFFPYAKDANDRMRVLIDNQIPISLYMANTSAAPGSANITPWSVHSGLLIDDRFNFTEAQQQTFNMTRGRWVVT